MTSVLVSGAETQVAEVAKALRDEGAKVTEVVDLADLPSVCAGAGPAAFDAYVQLAASFRIEGGTAIQRVRHFYADGVLARYTALDAALPSLSPQARITFVLGTLPPDVTTSADREARYALTQVLARAARADAGAGEPEVRILDADVTPDRIAAFAVGRVPSAGPPIPERMAELSLADWRVEMMSVMYVDT
jgi:hypothetical protein